MIQPGLTSLHVSSVISLIAHLERQGEGDGPAKAGGQQKLLGVEADAAARPAAEAVENGRVHRFEAPMGSERSRECSETHTGRQ